MPEISPPLVSTPGPTLADLVRVAAAIVNHPLLGPSFGESQTLRLIDSKHPLYTGPGALVPNTMNRWKCSLFVNSCLAAAGFQPATYGNGRGGEYAIAVELHRYSMQLQGRTKGLFDRRDTMLVSAFPDAAAREQRIVQLLATVQPGDMVIVRHQGGSGADGGHCRLAVADNGDGTFQFAQASSQAAVIRTEGPAALLREQEIWVLRPTKARAEGPVPIPT